MIAILRGQALWSATSSTLWLCHKPSLLSLKVGMPDSFDNPAPENTTIVFMVYYSFAFLYLVIIQVEQPSYLPKGLLIVVNMNPFMRLFVVYHLGAGRPPLH